MLQQFYEDVLPRHGHLCLLTLPSARHYWTSSIPELVALTSQIGKGEDVYFATAGFKTKDRHAFNADGMRCLRVDLDAGPEKLAKHGPEKVYADQRAALGGLVAFAAETGLAPTWIISSGVGLHVYWSLNTDVESREWQPLADALKELCRLKGLKADPTITADASRVLRPIGTVHVKSGGTVTVIKHTGRRWTSAELRAALARHVEVAPPGQRRYQAGGNPFAGMREVHGDTSINADVMPAYEPSDANLIAEQCPTIGHIRKTGGQVQEPLWRAALGVAKFTVQADDAAHAWSEGDARYDEDETQRKYEAWVVGPPSCKHIAEHSTLCGKCPHFGKITTPVELGRVAPAPPVQPVPVAAPQPAPPVEPWREYLPEQHAIKPVNGALALVAFVPEKDEHGKTVLDYNEASGTSVARYEQHTITGEPFWVTGWGVAENDLDESLFEITVLHSKNKTTPQAYTLPQKCSANVSELLGALANKGIHTKENKLMFNYVKDSIEKVKSINERPRVTDRMGVRYLSDGTLIAVHGNHIIYPNRTVRTALVASGLDNIANEFDLKLEAAPSGEFDASVWTGIEAKARRYLDFLGKCMPHPKMQLAVALGVSSPLLAFVSDTGYHANSKGTLPASGLTVSLFSRSSARGKTTAAQIAMLAFGNPSALTTGGSASASTDNARTTRMSMHGTMPMLVDEVGQADPKKAADLIEMVANGAARSRGNKDGGLNPTVPWSLITLMTTNVSARMMVNLDGAATDAIQARLLEIDTDDVPDYTPEQSAAFREEWGGVSESCHGALGAILHRELVALPAEARKKLESDCLARARTYLQAEQSGRFVYRALAAMLMQTVLLKRAGFALPFAMQPMLDAFKDAYDVGVNFVKNNTLPADACELLSIFVHENLRNTLVTDIAGGNHHVHPVMRNQRLPDTVNIRYCVEDQLMIVTLDSYRRWCQQKGLDLLTQIKQLAAAGVLNRTSRGPGIAQWTVKRAMCSGIAQAQAPVMAFAVFTNKLQEQTGEELDVPVEAPAPSNVVPFTR